MSVVVNDPLTLRPVTFDDAKLLFDWVNSADSLSQKAETRGSIPWDDHCSWLEARLNDRACRLFIIEYRGEPAGQVRLQPKSGNPHVDIYIAPSFRKRGIARRALSELLSRVEERPVVALVKHGNSASAALFRQLGFREDETLSGFVTFRLEE